MIVFNTKLSDKKHAETLVMLKILALGQQQIETKNFRYTEDVFNEIDGNEE